MSSPKPIIEGHRIVIYLNGSQVQQLTGMLDEDAVAIINRGVLANATDKLTKRVMKGGKTAWAEAARKEVLAQVNESAATVGVEFVHGFHNDPTLHAKLNDVRRKAIRRAVVQEETNIIETTAAQHVASAEFTSALAVQARRAVDNQMRRVLASFRDGVANKLTEALSGLLNREG